MPRRPVKPQDRQRVVRACDQCKSSKKRCNGSQPCSPCRKKGYDGICHYTAGRRHHPLPQTSSTLPQLAPAQDATLAFEGDSEAVFSPNSWDLQGPTTLLAGCTGPSFVNTVQGRTPDESTSTIDTRGSSIEVMAQPSVMLSSVSGEKVFVGNTAAISFLQFLQKTLERHVGPSGFTDAQESQRLFEADAVDNGSSRFYDGLCSEDKKAYIQHFFDASNGLLDLYTWEEVYHMLHVESQSNTCDASPTSQNPKVLETAALYLMVAIGAQCHGPTKDAATWAAELFSFARKLAFAHMLEIPSLDLVRVFLLMAFYMFGACRRNSAFMYLGIASKSADILGLHISAPQKHTATSTQNLRLRVAKSIRVFDVVCNSILGRSSSTPSLRQGQANYVSDRSDNAQDVVHRALTLSATYEITAVLDTAVKKSAEGELDADAAESLVLALQQRSRNFPSILRRPREDDSINNRHVIIGNMHVSGAYYFSVILVTRQFLIQHIIPQLTDDPKPLQPQDIAGRLKIDQLADACIEAATFMAHMCHQVMRSDHLLGNMCILKAWVFATGLVLGFSLLTEDTTHTSERRTAFLKSLYVLGELKHLSPQAEQYYRILSSFHQAIKTYKERMQRKKRASRGALVDCVFLPEGIGDTTEPEPDIATQLPSPELTMQDLSSADWLDSFPLEGLNNIEPVYPTCMGDNDIIMRMLWESERYAMDYPVGMLPDAEDTSSQDMGVMLS